MLKSKKQTPPEPIDVLSKFQIELDNIKKKKENQLVDVLEELGNEHPHCTEGLWMPKQAPFQSRMSRVGQRMKDWAQIGSKKDEDAI